MSPSLDSTGQISIRKLQTHDAPVSERINFNKMSPFTQTQTIPQEVVEIKTKEEYDLVLQNNEGRLLVIDFTATWCPPCQKIGPLFKELALTVNNMTTLAKVDVDDNSQTAHACGITAMPTFQFYLGTEMVEQLRGASIEGIKSKIDELAPLEELN